MFLLFYNYFTIIESLQFPVLQILQFTLPSPSIFQLLLTFGLYYKHMTIVNYASSIVDKLGASLTDDARVVIYDHHMFIVQATGVTHNDCHMTIKIFL